MNQVSHKIIAGVMAIVVLFTTMSFTVNMHYCGKTLVDYSLTNHTNSCGMDVKSVTADCDTTIDLKGCCSDKKIVATGKDDLKPVHYTLDLDQQFFVSAFVYSYYALLAPEQIDNLFYTDYSPPNLIRDIHIRDQVFII
tara:strand:- start:850 stop:1266 length:417 start_codon:yes stop_codon:yes gene_type:complete